MTVVLLCLSGPALAVGTSIGIVDVRWRTTEEWTQLLNKELSDQNISVNTTWLEMWLYSNSAFTTMCVVTYVVRGAVCLVGYMTVSPMPYDRPKCWVCSQSLLDVTRVWAPE